MDVRMSKRGQITIPGEIRRRMGLQPGEVIRLREAETTILLIPVRLDPVKAACGMFAGGPSLTEELLKERALDREREERKVARWLK